MNFVINYILIFVFLTGATSLSIEVTATRMLAPYFGNTIFTFSSVISVVLAALSFGYYYGGKLADKHPQKTYFYSIILASGLSVIFSHILLVFCLPLLAYKFSLMYGPLISSIVFFLIPNFFLGMLSPYAIKLMMQESNKKEVGSISGKVFFFSTLGSIFGSLLTGFVLITYLGVNEIFTYTGIFLALLGLVPLIFKKKLNLRKTTFLIIFLTVGFTFLSLAGKLTAPEVIYSKDGIYEKITILEKEYQGKKARFLMQDLSSSGAKFIESNELVFDYTKFYKLYEVFNVNVKNALFIGGGSYAMPYALHDKLPTVNVDVVEIEPRLYEVAKKYFNFSDSARLTNHITDGRRFLHDTNNTYDYIFSDVYYSLYSIPAHFTTEEFYRLTYDKLNDNGIFLANIIGSLLRSEPSLLFSQINTFRKIFPNSYFFTTKSPWSTEPQNFIFAGVKNSKIYYFENNNDLKLKENNLNLSRFRIEDYQYFTDNYTPIDYYTSSLIHKLLNNKSNLLNGDEMLSIIKQKLNYGPGYVGSEDKMLIENFLTSELEVLTDKVFLQEWEHKSLNNNTYKLKNIIGSNNTNNNKRIILASHYDSKKLGSSNENVINYVPGANDSSSGVAVIIEIARYFKSSKLKDLPGIDFIFFDGEEGEPDGDKNQWQSIGSNYFADNIRLIYPEKLPEKAIVIDMVCDRGLKIFMEKSSYNNAKNETDGFFEIASKLYPNNFNQKIKYEISDDHSPLNRIGIPSFLIIDFDYPYFHTEKDTSDKCSSQSLEIIAKTIAKYIESIK